MDRKAFYEKYICNTEDDVYAIAISGMDEEMRQDYEDMSARQTEAYKDVEMRMSLLDGGDDPAKLLHHYSETRTAAETVLCHAMFLYGAELMEKECAEKSWKLLTKLVK